MEKKENGGSEKKNSQHATINHARGRGAEAVRWINQKEDQKERTKRKQEIRNETNELERGKERKRTEKNQEMKQMSEEAKTDEPEFGNNKCVRRKAGVVLRSVLVSGR